MFTRPAPFSRLMLRSPLRMRTGLRKRYSRASIIAFAAAVHSTLPQIPSGRAARSVIQPAVKDGAVLLQTAIIRLVLVVDGDGARPGTGSRDGRLQVVGVEPAAVAPGGPPGGQEVDRPGVLPHGKLGTGRNRDARRPRQARDRA